MQQLNSIYDAIVKVVTNNELSEKSNDKKTQIVQVLYGSILEQTNSKYKTKEDVFVFDEKIDVNYFNNILNFMKSVFSNQESVTVVEQNRRLYIFEDEQTTIIKKTKENDYLCNTFKVNDILCMHDFVSQNTPINTRILSKQIEVIEISKSTLDFDLILDQSTIEFNFSGWLKVVFIKERDITSNDNEQSMIYKITLELGHKVNTDIVNQAWFKFMYESIENVVLYGYKKTQPIKSKLVRNF